MPEQTFTIFIPGVQDVIRVPALEDVNLRRERIQRYKQQRQDRPNWMQTLSDWIGTLDDIEDHLSVALTLAKPLLRNLPARLIPGLGWILTAKDLIDLTASLLAVSPVGRANKAAAKNSLDVLTRDRKGSISATKAFFKHTNWGSFALEATQVLETWTGYGLSFGPIMGLAGDAMYSAYNTAVGGDLRIAGPPPSDFLSKGGRAVIGAAKVLKDSAAMTAEEIQNVMASLNEGGRDLHNPSYVPVTKAEIDAAGLWPVVARRPWNPATIEALELEGIDYSSPEPFRQDPSVWPTYGQHAQDFHDTWRDIEATIIRVLGQTTKGQVTQLIASEAAEAMVTIVSEAPPEPPPDKTNYDDAVLRLIEWDVIPWWWPDPPVRMARLQEADALDYARNELNTEAVARAMNHARNVANSFGREFVNRDDVQVAARDLWFGYARFPRSNLAWSDPNRTPWGSMAVARRLGLTLERCPLITGPRPSWWCGVVTSPTLTFDPKIECPPEGSECL